MSDTKLDPATLSAEERAIVDHEASRFHRDWSGEARYKSALSICEPHILARRALFAPAPEKVVCPNCLRETETTFQHEIRLPAGYSPEYACQPEPAAPEMPEAVRLAVYHLFMDAETYRNREQSACAEVNERTARNLESWWRTHSTAQPVAVGMTEELSMVLLRAEYGATEDESNPNLRDGYVARLKDAIAAVREAYK